MAATLAYYRDKLGFDCVGTWIRTGYATLERLTVDNLLELW
jgi:hypothetical protein